jgi:hypothetical protein
MAYRIPLIRKPFRISEPETGINSVFTEFIIIIGSFTF